MASVAAAGIADAMAKTWSSFIQGEDATKTFGQVLGDLLIMMGEMLITMAIAAPIRAFMDALFSGGGLIAAFKAFAATLPLAAIGLAAGTALILAGSAMGGGAKKTAKETSQNTANGANASTGAKPDDNWDPNKDPRTLYQKQQLAQIKIDIRHDDGIIVKKVIKAVNMNGRLSTLIGNRALNF